MDYSQLKWVDIPGYEFYQASDQGFIRHFWVEKNKYNIFKGNLNENGYKTVYVNRKSMYLHRLIALTFVENPLNKPQVNHIDGNPLNNISSNLEWCTRQENILHAHSGGKIYKNVVVKKPVKCIETGQVFNSIKEANAFFKLSPKTILRSIKKNRLVKKINKKFELVNGQNLV